MTSIDFSLAGVGLSLAPLKKFLSDPEVSEILINEPELVFVEKNGEMRPFPAYELTHLTLKELFNVLVVSNKGKFDEDNPIFFGTLPDGSRVTLIHPYVANNYSLSIRKESIKDLNLEDYLELDFFSSFKPSNKSINGELTYLDELYLNLNPPFSIIDFLREAILTRQNIVISGGPSSGKTTFLNSLIKEISPTTRLIAIENPRDLKINHRNKVSLLVKPGVATAQDLVKACMRLRPDRLIMGEIVGGEIMDFVTSCITGVEGSMTTIHATSPNDAFYRLSGLYKHNDIVMTEDEIKTEIKNAIDIIIQLKKTDHGRRLTEIWYKRAET